jgi:serine/threonine protein phosphatase 1
MRQFAVSDIHGCPHTFTALLDTIACSRADELYLLGDYVDRGPDSKGVIDAIFDMQKAGYAVYCLRGNHEDLVLQAAAGDYTGLERWLLTDGKDTMDSFGVDNCADIPAGYLQWMAGLPYFLEVDAFILVHGGLDFSTADPLVPTDRMAWMRSWYGDIRYDWLGGRFIVHGHTPMPHYDIERQLFHFDQHRYIDIDAGCVFTQYRYPHRRDFGRLCAFDLTNRRLVFQENVDTWQFQ